MRSMLYSWDPVVIVTICMHVSRICLKCADSRQHLNKCEKATCSDFWWRYFCKYRHFSKGQTCLNMCVSVVSITGPFVYVNNWLWTDVCCCVCGWSVCLKYQNVNRCFSAVVCVCCVWMRCLSIIQEYEQTLLCCYMYELCVNEVSLSGPFASQYMNMNRYFSVMCMSGAIFMLSTTGSTVY